MASLALTFCMALSPSCHQLQAQPSLVGTVKNFRVSPEFYPPPHERQMKSHLEGSEAVPQPGNRVLVNNARLQTFRADGQKELLVETPQCVYDPAARIINSPGAIRISTADGKFFLEGLGFLWQQADSSVVISNEVRTVLDPSLVATDSGDKQRSSPRDFPVEIRSDRFDYTTGTGLGVFRNHVRVAGTNLAMTAGELSFKLPMGERQLQSIEARQDVTVDYGDVHATGQSAYYSAGAGPVRVTGEPKWRVEQQEGSGRELIIDPTNRVVRVVGDAFMKLPGEGLRASGFLSPKPSSPRPRLVLVPCLAGKRDRSPL